MAAKRLLILCVVAAVSTLTGCRMWCDHHYPCQQPACYAPPQQCCVPCCPQQPNVPPPPQPVNYQGTNCPCGPVSRQAAP